MSDIRKEQEREELHKTIWGIADDLRGSVDGWDFKSYVLGMMFYRYISENLTNYINAGEAEAGNTDFDYAKLSDEDAEQARTDLVNTKGFFILPSELFVNVRARAARDENLNETLERVFKHIEESAKGSVSEDDFAGLFDDIDVNSNKLGATVAKRNDKLVKLMNGIGEMKLGNYKDNTIDAFGDAYEYLMGMYASNAGKSGGEYFTPQEVSELLTCLAVVGKTEVNKVYDPACGSGSLLLKAAKILGKENIRQGFWGQEIKGLRGTCESTHYVREDSLEQVVKMELFKLATYLDHDENAFAELLEHKSNKDSMVERKAAESALAAATARSQELLRLYERVYEDNVNGKVTDDWFMRLSHKYEVEQEELKKQMFDLRNKIERLDTAQNSSGSFIRAIRKFMTMQVLTPVVLQELIDKIEVFPIEGTGKNRTQRLVIHYRFVGCIDLPSIVPKHTYKLDSRQGVAIEYLPSAV